MKYFDTENNFLTVNAYNANVDEIIDRLNNHIYWNKNDNYVIIVSRKELVSYERFI